MGCSAERRELHAIQKHGVTCLEELAGAHMKLGWKERLSALPLQTVSPGSGCVGLTRSPGQGHPVPCASRVVASLSGSDVSAWVGPSICQGGMDTPAEAGGHILNTEAQSMETPNTHKTHTDNTETENTETQYGHTMLTQYRHTTLTHTTVTQTHHTHTTGTWKQHRLAHTMWRYTALRHTQHRHNTNTCHTHMTGHTHTTLTHTQCGHTQQDLRHTQHGHTQAGSCKQH